MKTKPLIIIAIAVAALAATVLVTRRPPQKVTVQKTLKDTGPAPSTVAPTPPIVKDDDTLYTAITIATADPVAEIAAKVGAENVPNVLRLNRINSNVIKAGAVIVIPSDPADFDSLSPFPTQLPDAAAIPKLMMVSQRVQAFGLYENGRLVKWGPVSTGKQSTQTANRLYFTNWKGKEVRSSFSDEWLLKWNFNLDNAEGIGMHQYEMPGYPASHSCIRMFGNDAEWVYNWADQWIVSDDEQTVLASGTPVLVFGSYAYGKTAPWKTLAKNPDATTLSESEVDKALSPAIDEIARKQQERIEYLKQ